VMGLTDHFSRDIKGSTLMITHNLKDAIAHGNRLLMMKEGRIAYQCEGAEKAHLTMADLITRYTEEGLDSLGSSELS